MGLGGMDPQARVIWRDTGIETNREASKEVMPDPCSRIKTVERSDAMYTHAAAGRYRKKSERYSEPADLCTDKWDSRC